MGFFDMDFYLYIVLINPLTFSVWLITDCLCDVYSHWRPMQYFQAIIYSVCTICNGELITRGWNNCIDLIAKITCFSSLLYIRVSEAATGGWKIVYFDGDLNSIQKKNPIFLVVFGHCIVF